MIAPALEALDILRTRTLASLAGEAIERLIVDGELKAGEHLNELALAARLGISRGPIREAIRGLERGGLIVTVVNQGSFVRKISADEAHELYDIRIALTGYACAHLAQHATADQVKTLRDKLKRMSVAQAAGDAADYYVGNVDFHDALMMFAGNRRAVRICEELGQELNLFRRRSLVSPEGMKASNAEHAEIVRAIAAGDVARAREAGEAHIRRGLDRFEASTPRLEPAVMRKSRERVVKD
jgi:DNA-binding GntR family transcriptional regulator